MEVRKLLRVENILQRGSASQVFNVSVSTQTGVVGEIPANVVGILVDHDLIARPVPVCDDVVIERGDVPVKTAKPEAFAVSSRQHEDMLRSKTAAEMPVCPRLREVVMRIVRATLMSHPLVVPGVYMRNVRMALLVHFHVVLGRRLRCLGRGPRRLGGLRGSGTVSGNVSTPNCGVTASLRRPTASA